jgi:hypothetical protein
VITGLKYDTKEADQHKKELEENSNTAKKANTGTTKLPLTTATHRYWKSEVKTNSRKLILRTRQKPPPVYITDVKNISLIQLLGQIANQQYEIKALADN